MSDAARMLAAWQAFRQPAPAAGPAPPARPSPQPVARPAAAPVKSLDELRAMQRDPRYARPDLREPAYVAAVDAEWRRAFPGPLPASHVGRHVR